MAAENPKCISRVESYLNLGAEVQLRGLFQGAEYILNLM